MVAAGRVLGCYHTHSALDDGHGELEDYVQAAIRKGLGYLGFSGHSPVPFGTDWNMPRDRLDTYLAEARRLKEAYAGRITILVGLEVDYLPNVQSPRSAHISELGLDYTLGSVHFLGTLRNGAPWTVDTTLEVTRQGIAESFGGDTQAAVAEYYGRVAEMVRTAPPDIVGHLDLVRKYNRGAALFDEDAPWYRQAVLGALEAVRESGCVLEVNNGGISRGLMETPYPSPWILKECLGRGMRVVVNADAHYPQNVDAHYDKAFAVLRGVGFQTHWILTPRGWQEHPILASGISAPETQSTRTVPG